MRSRAALSAGVIVALLVGVWASTAGDDDPPETTTTSTTPLRPTTTTTTFDTTTTTVPPPSTTATSVPPTTVDSEARVEEVRLILEDLYFRWFDAIYHNDEEAVREVIATEQGLGNFERATSESNLETPPERDLIRISVLEVLHDEPDCLVTFSALDITQWRGPEAETQVVDVLWPHDDGWRFVTSWQSKDDLWEQDCTAEREGELP